MLPTILTPQHGVPQNTGKGVGYDDGSYRLAKICIIYYKAGST